MLEKDACAIPSPFSAVGTGRDSIISDLYQGTSPCSSVHFRKMQHHVPVLGTHGVCNLLVRSGKSVHKRRLLKLFLKCSELLFQFGDFVAKVDDFPFEIDQTFRVRCGHARFVA
jgi:hypothetical protein